ncbi:MAG: MmgE/PrpD family protein [Candidatus Rokubacteria bacterium]|nr:MmgE/PrpD family protein [Candidatus Rokubacteria bacterium]
MSHSPTGVSVIEQLAAYAANESFEKLPDAAVRAARRAMLDTLGVMLAGSVEITASRVRALIAHRRGADEATVVGTGVRAPVEDAALANGTAAHALDYDDLHQSLSGHPSVPVLPAALALAERERAAGTALVTAFVVGVELEAKLGRVFNPAHYEVGWHATATLGVFGAAAASAKLLGASTATMARALGIAASLASGIKANFGTDCKPLHAGHAARCGVEAALLAAAGFTANARVLEHGDGFGSTYGAGSPLAWDHAVTGLGAPHEIVDPGVGVKRFPACASTHQALDATLALAEEHAIDPASVEAVECAVHYLAPHQLIYDRAETGLQGKFSMPYCVSAALLDRAVRFAQFEDDRVRRADVQAFMPKVRMVVHPDQTTRECLPTRFSEVTITLANGRRLQRRVSQAKGQPKNPLTDAELEAKFRDCATRVMSAARVETLLGQIKALETVTDVSALTRLLTG